MKQSGKGGVKAHTKATQGGPKDRRSTTGVSGSPKKGGHGGKYTWSDDGDHLHEAALDFKDPKFVDAEVHGDAATTAK